MLEHLINAGNEITVIEVVCDREQNELVRFEIGRGYGIITSLSQEAISRYGNDAFKYSGLIVHYKSFTTQPVALGGITYVSESPVPRINSNRRKYLLKWHGIEYSVLAVEDRYNIDGIFVAYKVYSTNA